MTELVFVGGIVGEITGASTGVRVDGGSVVSGVGGGVVPIGGSVVGGGVMIGCGVATGDGTNNESVAVSPNVPSDDSCLPYTKTVYAWPWFDCQE